MYIPMREIKLYPLDMTTKKAVNMGEASNRNYGLSNELDEATTLRTLNAFAVDLISIPSVEDLFWYVARNVVGRLRFADCVIYQANEAQTQLTQVAALGNKNPFGRSILNPLKIPFGEGITGQVAESRESIIVDDLQSDQNYIADTRPARSEICVPLVCGNRVVGVIDSEHPSPAAFGEAELEVLITIAALTSAKLELLAEADRSKRRYHELVDAHAQLSQETTSRRALEAKLFNARKLETIGRLTGRFAHEFNNLLTVISGNLEFLSHDLVDDAALATLDAAQTAAGRASKLVISMLAYSQRARLKPEVIEVGVVMQSLLNKSTHSGNSTVKLNLMQPVSPICVDPRVFEAAILNIIANAWDATPCGGAIRVDAENITYQTGDQRQLVTAILPGKYVRLSIHDTGSGIAPESLQQVFDPFFTTKVVGEGIGLGLSMALGFMQQSGGTIEVQSQLGKGSTFALYFPATSIPAAIC